MNKMRPITENLCRIDMTRPYVIDGVVTEWLTCSPRKAVLFEGVGSNPANVDVFFISLVGYKYYKYYMYVHVRVSSWI